MEVRATEPCLKYCSISGSLTQDVSGYIVSADALKAEALNEHFNSVYTEEGSIPLPNLGESPYGGIDRLQISISGVLDQLLLLLHLFPLLCGVDVSCETPPSRPVLRVLLRQPPLRQVVPDVIHPPPLWSSSPSFPRHLHPQYSLPYVFVFSSRNMPIPL